MDHWEGWSGQAGGDGRLLAGDAVHADRRAHYPLHLQQHRQWGRHPNQENQIQTGHLVEGNSDHHSTHQVSFLTQIFRRIPRINLPSPVLESTSRRSSRFPRPSSSSPTRMARPPRALGPVRLGRTGSLCDPVQSWWSILWLSLLLAINLNKRAHHTNGFISNFCVVG